MFTKLYSTPFYPWGIDPLPPCPHPDYFPY